MQRRNSSLQFLEVYDPDNSKEGTDFNSFFSKLKVGDNFQVDENFGTDPGSVAEFIINIARNYGLIVHQEAYGVYSSDDLLFEVADYVYLKESDDWYRETVRLFRTFSPEERLLIMDRIYETFCKDCMEEIRGGKMNCDCEYGPSEERC